MEATRPFTFFDPRGVKRVGGGYVHRSLGQSESANASCGLHFCDSVTTQPMVGSVQVWTPLSAESGLPELAEIVSLA
jgi:hypothetical protein